MANVQQLLNGKSNQVWTTDPDDTVFDAIRMMADKDVGALVVIEDGKPIGIFTERDYARKVVLEDRQSKTTPVRDVMSTRIVCASPEQTIEECMAVMTDKRVRHLPVLEDGKLAGIVSIGDLVKSRIADQEFLIEQLAHYIHG
jgi:CBS domain-containing protein